MTSKSAILLLANGAEEMEVVITVDILRRAGITVTVAGLSGNAPVKCSREVVIFPDMSFTDALKNLPYDVVVVPGGAVGAKQLSESSQVGDMLLDQERNKRWIAAICAGPTVLKAHGVAVGKKITSYPTTRNEMTEGGKYNYIEENVVVDDHLITSRGPGLTFDFGLSIVENVLGKITRDHVAQGLLLY